MNATHFRKEMDRIIIRFGERSIDDEFIKLVWREVGAMSDQDFTKAVDTMIGNRPASKPPLLVDFQEARLKFEKYKFNREVETATNTMHGPPQEGLKAFLAKNYPDAKCLWDAVQHERDMIRIRRALEDDNDPKGAA